MNAPVASRRSTIAAVLLAAFVYLYLFPYQPELNNPNENIRLYMTAAMVEEGRFEIDEIRRRWGWTNDAACVDRDAEGTPIACDGRVAPGSTRHYYSVKAPGTSYLGVPGYALYYAYAGDELDQATALWFCRVSGTVLPWLLFLWFFYRFLSRHTEHRVLRDGVFLTVAFGSSLFGYTLMFASHTTAAAFAFGAFMLLYEARRRGTLGAPAAAVAGFLTAGLSVFEYPCFFISVILCVYSLTALRPYRRVVPFALGALIPVLVLMHFQGTVFGNPFSPGHLFVESPAFRQGHQAGLFGAEVFHWDGAVSLLFHRRLGMFSLSPLLFLALFGLPLLVLSRERRADAMTAIASASVLYVFVCFLNVWHAGWSVGPRYLTALIPFLGWGALEFLDRMARRRPHVAASIALGATAAAFVAAGIPSAYYPHIPPQFTYPVAHLFTVLIADDFAPHNAANLLGVYGTLSMLPPALLVGGALVWTLRAIGGRKERLMTLGGGAALAALLLAPHLIAPAPDLDVQHGVSFVTEHWSPAGHDRASRLAAELAASADPSPEGYEHLAEIYHRDGRRQLEVDALGRADELAAAAFNDRD